MRITNSMLIKNMLWNSNNNLVSMSNYQNQMSTGKKITRPSDDPVGITKVMKYKTDIRETQQYSKNIDDALGWLEVSESSITNIKDILQRVRELTVQAANGTNTAGDTDKIRVEIEELTKEIMVSGNATSAGRYLFSGMETNKKLFNEDGTFAIDMTSERSDLKHVMGYEVSVGEVMSVGVHPKDLFGIVSTNNFFQNFMTRQTGVTTKATQSIMKFDMDLDHDYSGDTLDINFNGNTFDVDESVLENSAVNPLTKERVIDAFKSATFGAIPLGSVADVYYDLNDQLVIQSKAYGNTGALAFNVAPPPQVTNVSSVNGVDGSSETLDGIGTLTDADVASAASNLEEHTFIIQVDGKREKITVDFTGMATVGDLTTDIQNQLNTLFVAPGPTVTVGTASGGLDFSVGGLNDGEAHTISVDYIVASESEMISDLQALATALSTKDDAVLQTSLGKMDLHLDRVLTVLGEIGGKNNRVEFIQSRVDDNEITFTSLLSKVQDVDMAEAIMYFKNLENIYRASLSVGSKVIQPSLVDFIR